MDFLPISLRISGSGCCWWVVARWPPARRDCCSEAGASLTVVAPAIAAELEQMLAQSGGSWQQGGIVQRRWRAPCWPVAATPLRQVNEQVFRDASARQLPVNVVDALSCARLSSLDRGTLTADHRDFQQW